MLDQGYDAERNTFVQYYGSTEVDAALLVLPQIGIIAGDDPRMLGTIEAIERDLMRDGLLLRYRTQTGVDGLAGDEHPFLACSFWLVSAYAGAGRLDDADALFDRLCDLTNDVGLLSEEYDVGRAPDGRQLPAGVQPPRPWCTRRSTSPRRATALTHVDPPPRRAGSARVATSDDPDDHGVRARLERRCRGS